MAVLNLTEARIRELPLGSGIHRDSQVKGLMVICHKTTKSYACQGDVRRNGRHIRTVRVKIDRVDRIGLRDARNRAKALMSQIQSGIDPTDGPDETGITLERALEVHLSEKPHRPRTEEGYRYHLDHYLKAWRKKAVADISRQMVRDMFGDLKRKHGETKLRVRKFESLVYLPGKSEFPDGEEGGRYNIWRDSGVDATPGNVAAFLDHIGNVVPDEIERGYVLDYLAMLVQSPGRKVHYALLIRGGQGTGKSWIGRMMTAIIGAPNVVFPSNDEVLSQWTVWTEGSCLAVIEELMARGRLDMANRLKPIITEPTLRIEEKKRSIYTIPNHLNLIAFTNHEDALPLENGDRRWLVISSEMRPLDEGYYERLFAFLDGDGPAAVKHYLMQRKVVLNPKGMAPTTRGKQEMRRRSLSEAEQYLAELLEGHEGPFAFDLVRLEELVACVPTDLKRHTRNVRTKVAAWLKDEVGAVKHTRYTKGDDDARPSCQLWSIRNHDEWAGAGAAARAEAYQRRHGDEVDS